MAAHPSQESRPLKKPRLGPPDVYPQDPKQREDELTSTSVKHGFSNTVLFSDEYSSVIGSDRTINISPEKMGTFFNAILAKKAELNMFQDTAKKKQQMIREHFCPVLPRTRNTMESWFKDLAGSKPLSQLSKKVPSFGKKEETFSTLCEFFIPMVKAAWFIKMTAAQNAAVQENRTKKRQNIDQSIEWTQALCKFLKEQIHKIHEHYGGSSGPSGTSFLTATQAPSQVDLDSALKQGHYCCKLARHMYDEGLLDRQEFLSWLIELLEKMKQSDDTVLKFIMAQVLQYLDEITLSAHLSRRLAHFCAKKLAQMCYDSGCTSPRTQSPMLTNNGSGTMGSENTNQIVQQNPVAAIFMEYNKCPQHRSIIQSLSAVLQVITLLCPTALIWNSLGDGKSSMMLCGSPLDLLPCAPSSLPMPPSPQNAQIRMQIQSAEHQIKLRGRAAEVRWSSDKCQQSTTGFTISKVLGVLDILDRHNFDKVESSTSLDSLYNKIFSINQNKEGNEPLVSDEPILGLLIDWAVSTHRTGRHRGVVVAKLIEKRQNELRSEKFADNEMMDDKESVGSDTMAPTGLPAFQSLLLDFLDNRAPVLTDNYTEENKQAFDNLIQLFSELIRHDVFSHDAYLCTLISRGDLVSSSTATVPLSDSMDISSVKSHIESMRNEPADDYKVEMDIQTMDSELGSLFGTVKEEQKSSPEAPASVTSIKSEREQPISNVDPMSLAMSLAVPMEQPPPVQPPKGPSRHMLFATHFPIPHEEMSVHECNQRMIVLYGVGKARDEARHIVKKIGKDIMKFFSKRNCIDISSGDLGKAKKKKEKDIGETTNMDMILHKFQKLSYHDQHAVTWQCAASVIDQIGSFAAGNSSYLPLVDNISNLMDLLEFAQNYNGRLEFSIQLLRELRAIEHQLVEQKSNLAGNYTPYLCLCIVGIFREYHAYLMVSQDLTIQAFEGWISVVKQVGNPTDCTSSERCVLAYLYDVYTSCSYLKTKFSDIFSIPYTRMKETLYADICPSASNLLWDPGFMTDFISSVKSQPDASLIKQLNDKPANRYSFVCNAMLDICNSQGIDKLNEISLLCAELTSRCNALSSEWLGVLKALCCSSNHSCGFIDVLTQYDVSDLSIHDSLAVFTAILIARHCFSLQDLVVHVALPSLLAACPSTGGNADAEPGARLTCHLLLRLFKTSHFAITSQSPAFSVKSSCGIKASCDRHLLEATHDSITVGAVLAVLKAMLVLGDSCSDDLRLKQSNIMKKVDNGIDLFESLVKGLEDDVDMDLMLGTTKSKGGMETAGLSDYAKHALKEMCSQEWVREKFLKDPSSLFTQDLLLDSMLKSKQAQQLLQMICYQNGIPSRMDDGEEENKQAIQRILNSLDQWSLRVSLLELQLMFQQANTQSETNSILDNVARGTVELFHQQTETGRNMTENSLPSDDQSSQDSYKDSIWLIAPLISKLPSAVQGRVLKLAGQVLENGNNFLSNGRPDKESKQRNKSLLSHQPFLSLVLTCLKGQDEQREGLLSSLHSQLEKFISNCKEILDKHPEENKIRQDIHEAIQLRLSLVGGMFDTIQRNTSNTTDWALLLVQLITGGVVDIQTNLELFTTILDMLSVLIHGTLMPDSEKGEENKRTYLTLIKKIKRDIGDKHSESLDKLRQLLPLPKRVYEVILCDPHRSSTEKYRKQNPGYNSALKKQGLKVAKKELISPWEVIEGFKYPPPLSWTFFNAVKVERKTLKFEEQHRLQFYHTHSLRKPLSHYLDPPPLPEEDLEPPPDKTHDEKPQEQVDTRVNDTGKKSKKAKKPRVPRNPTGGYMPQAPSMRQLPYHDSMYQPQQSGWYGPPQPQPPYYSQQLPPGQDDRSRRISRGYDQKAPTRYSNYANPTNSKQSLQTFIRARQSPASSSYAVNASQQMLYQKQRQQQLLRQQILRRQGQQVEQPGMFSAPIQQGSQQSMMHSMNQCMSQNYGSYSGMQPPQQQSLMEPVSSNVMQPGYSQSYQQGQNPSMMQQMPQQYMQQQPPQSQVTQPPYNPVPSRLQHTIGNTSGLQNPNTQMNTMSQSMPSYNQMGPSAPPPPAPSYMPAPPAQSSQQRMQQQQQLRQQQMMALQKQQIQQQHQTSQHQNAALVAQLQLQMPGGPPPPGPQYNTYPQPPQYQ